MSRELGYKLTSSDLLADDSGNWLLTNVLGPAANTTLLEPYNAVAHTVNEASALVGASKLLPEAKIQAHAARLWTKEWYAQNLSSGLAMTIPYGIAAVLTGRGLHRIGKALNAEGVPALILRSKHTASILGAGIYDGFRVPHEGETRFGNSFGGMLGFAVFEAGNHRLKNLSAVRQIPGRMLVGMTGAVSHQTLSHLISHGALPKSEQLWEAAMTGGTMNIALPYVHRKIERGINEINHSLGRGAPLDSHLRAKFDDAPQQRSELLNQLVSENPWITVVENSTSTRLLNKHSTIELTTRQSSPAHIGHELTHSSLLRSPASEAAFARAADHLRAGRTNEAWETYRDTRLSQEVTAINNERRIRQDIEGVAAEPAVAPDVLKLLADGTRTYEQVWKQEFEQLQKTEGQYRPEKDFAGSSRDWENNYYRYGSLPASERIAMARSVSQAPSFYQGDFIELMIRDNNPSVRFAVLDQFQQLAFSDRIRLFEQALEHPDFYTRLAAVDRIGHLPEEARPNAIETALTRGDILDYPIDPRLVERYGSDDARARFAPEPPETRHGQLDAALSKTTAELLVEQLAHVSDKDSALSLWQRMFDDSRPRRAAVEALGKLPAEARTQAWWKSWDHWSCEYGDANIAMLKRLGTMVELLPHGDRAKALEAYKMSWAYENRAKAKSESGKRPGTIDWSQTTRDYARLDADSKVQIAGRLKECPDYARGQLWERLISDSDLKVRFSAVEAIAHLSATQQRRAWYRAIGDADYHTRMLAVSRICDLPAGERLSAWRHVLNHKAVFELPINAQLQAKQNGRREYARAVPEIPENTAAHVRQVLNKDAAALLVEQIASLPGVENRERAWRAALADKRTTRAAIENFQVLPTASRGALWLEAWNTNCGARPPEIAPATSAYSGLWGSTSPYRRNYHHFKGNTDGLKILLKQAATLPGPDRIRAWDSYIDFVERYWQSTSVETVRAVELLAALPENVQTDPRTRLGEWHLLLDKFTEWNEKEVDSYVRQRILEKTDMGLSEMIAGLPEHQRADAWHHAYDRLGVTRLPKLAESVKNLPQADRIEAFVRLTREEPCAEVKAALETAVRWLPADALVRGTEAVLSSNRGSSRGAIIAQLPFYNMPRGTADYNIQVTKSILRAIERDGTIAPEHLRKIFEELPEVEVEGNPEATPVRDAVIADLSPQFLSKLFFEPTDHAVAERFAAAHPDVIRKMAREFYGAGGPADLLPTAAQVWLATGSLRLTSEVGEAVFKKSATKEDMQYTSFARLVEELSSKADATDRAQLLQSLRTRIEQSSGDEAAGLLQYAAKIGKADPPSLRANVLAPLEVALADRSRDYSWRLSMAREAGRVIREDHLAPEMLTLPDLRMRGVELPDAQRRNLRDTSEQALMNPEQLAGLFGEGELGRVLPTVFGAQEKGGFVGRPQHGGHEYPLDQHTVLVVQRVREHPEFATLSAKDQINVLWAALLHDVGKRASISDPGHEWASANIAWGVLETMGYPPERIQRVANLISRHGELSFNPKERQSQTLQDAQKAMELAVFYRHPSALQQLRILNESDIRSINSGSTYWTPEVQAELRQISSIVQKQRKILDSNTVPVLTTALPGRTGLYSLTSDYAVLAHASSYLETAFLKQLSLIESPEYSMSSSLITNRHRALYWKEASLVALVTGPTEHIAQLDRANLGSGRNVDWSRHVKLAREVADERPKFVAEVDERIARMSRAAGGGPATLANLWRSLSQYDNLTELHARGASDPLVQSYGQIVQSLTTTKSGRPLQDHNEIKILNPKVVGIGLLRQGRPVVLEGITPADLSRMLTDGSRPSWLASESAATANTLSVPRTVWQEAINRNLPIVSLE